MNERKELISIKRIGIILIGLMSLLIFISTLDLFLNKKAIDANDAFLGTDQFFLSKMSDLYIKGKYNDCIHLATARLETHPGDSFGFYYRGMSYYYLGRDKEALEDLRWAVDIRPHWESMVSRAVKNIKARRSKDN